MTLLERLGAHAVRAGLSGPVQQAARLHLADTVAAWVAGSATAEGRGLVKFWGSDLSDRVALHCALARLSEIDDIHLSSATTPGALVVPAALTMAAALGRDGGALAQAIAVGYDAMTRLGAALNGPTILYRGIWPTYLAAPFAVAAVASRLLGLAEKQAAHALAIALSLSSPAVGRQSGASTSRWLAIGNAARNGLIAARSAQAGFTGDLGIFEGDFFRSIYGLSPDSASLLDERPVLPDVSFKPWCAARQTMAAAQALRELMEAGLSPADLTELVVSVPRLYLKMIDHGIVAGDRTSHLTSVSHQLALAALAPETMLDIRQAPEFVSNEIRALMDKVSVKADDALLGHYPGSWPARLEVGTRSGSRDRLVLHVPGDPQRPFDEFMLAAKFRRVTARIIGEQAAENLLRSGLAAVEEGGALNVLLAGIEQAVFSGHSFGGEVRR